jgi:hypothetical protein
MQALWVRQPCCLSELDAQPQVSQDSAVAVSWYKMYLPTYLSTRVPVIRTKWMVMLMSGVHLSLTHVSHSESSSIAKYTLFFQHDLISVTSMR